MAFAMQTRSAAATSRTARSAVGPRTAFRVSSAQRRVIARAGAVSEIVEKLKTLTLLEASELVAEIEKTFGVDASAAVAAPAGAVGGGGAAPAAAAPVEEVKTAFDLVLESIPADKKVSVYKIVRSIAGIAVNQVKDFTATLPKVLKEGCTKEEAEEGKRQLTEAGAGAKVV